MKNKIQYTETLLWYNNIPFQTDCQVLKSHAKYHVSIRI